MRGGKALVVAGLFVATQLANSEARAARPFSWTGFYIGGHGQILDVDYKTFWEEHHYTLLGGGAHIGYTHQTGAFVIGIEADVSGHESPATRALFSVRARAGVVAGPALFYGTVGLAGGVAGFADLGKLDTLIYGGGIELSLGQRWSARGEVFLDGPVETSIYRLGVSYRFN